MHDDPMLKIALALEKIALEDDYFVERKLYPNIDFYSGITLRALGFPTSMFTALFALARTVGWIAQWKEMLEDPHQKIGRPRQIYTGKSQRDYVPLSKRSSGLAFAPLTRPYAVATDPRDDGRVTRVMLTPHFAGEPRSTHKQTPPDGPPAAFALAKYRSAGLRKAPAGADRQARLFRPPRSLRCRAGAARRPGPHRHRAGACDSAPRPVC